MSGTRPKVAEKTGRLTRGIWIGEGLRILAQHGEAAVRVDVIARKLKISRGSFYWHFKNRAAFLAAILDEWHRASTIAIQKLLNRSALTPAKRIAFLLDLANRRDPMEPGGSIERALGQWASSNRKVAEMLATVHRERIRYCESLLRDSGHKEPALMAEILYGFIVGRNQIATHASLGTLPVDTTLRMIGVSVGASTVERRARKSRVSS